MKKTVLIPTDFTIESLNALKTFLQQADNHYHHNIILLHGISFTDSITDALFFSKAKFINSVADKDFSDACNIIRNKFSEQIATIRKDVFTGFSQAAFNNYIDANGIDEAYIPANSKINLVYKNSVDIIPFIKKSKLIVSEIEWQIDELLPEKGKLAEIFFNNVPAAQ